jgi:hypothetical protein
MLTILQLTTLFLIALTMACAVAHALELPGKMRLPKEVYLSVQPIYYPGFTVVGGFAEFGALLMLFALLFLTPREGPTFALTLWAFIALLSLQVVFWVVSVMREPSYASYNQRIVARVFFLGGSR